MGHENKLISRREKLVGGRSWCSSGAVTLVIPNTYPTIEVWKPILVSYLVTTIYQCIRNFESYHITGGEGIGLDGAAFVGGGVIGDGRGQQTYWG